MKKKRMKRIIAFFLVFIIAGGIFMFLSFRYKYRDLTVYTERLLDIELKDYIETAEGEVKNTGFIGWEEYATFKLKVKAGEEKNVLNIFKNRCGKGVDLTTYVMPGHMGHEFVTEIKKSDIQFVWEVMMEGKRAKTRVVMIYAVLDKNGRMYVYLL